MHAPRCSTLIKTLAAAAIIHLLACFISPANAATQSAPPPPAIEKMTDLDAWTAVPQMTPGVNIGNTLENTVHWETGWGNPPITREYIQSLAHLGFKTVRLPVAWDTYAENGRIAPDKLRRVAEVIDWINDAGMFCVLNIHWDGGWIDSDVKEHFPKPYTFSPEAETKFRSYWQQISQHFAGKNQRLIFESLNEESNFSNEGSPEKAYATLTRVNQLFIDTVRKTGGNNANRLLVVAGYNTDFEKTSRNEFKMPTDTVPGKLFISVHYYTPFQFCGLTEDASWGKMMRTWGTPQDVAQLNQLFDTMHEFCTRTNTPAFIGEFGVEGSKESASRVRWMTAVVNAAIARKMIPVLWDTGGDISRREPYAASDVLTQTLRNTGVTAATTAPAVR